MGGLWGEVRGGQGGAGDRDSAGLVSGTRACPAANPEGPHPPPAPKPGWGVPSMGVPRTGGHGVSHPPLAVG